MDYRPIRVSDLIREINRELYLPAIQREFVWGTDKVERLFDSIMGDFPIGSFLFWRLEQEHKDKWPIYEFIRAFDDESPHNPPANLAGITTDIKLVIDGQQRITSLYIGLKGSYRYFYYRWRKTQLFLKPAAAHHLIPMFRHRLPYRATRSTIYDEYELSRTYLKSHELSRTSH